VFEAGIYGVDRVRIYVRVAYMINRKREN